MLSINMLSAGGHQMATFRRPLNGLPSRFQCRV